ncbi:hypothetical protein K505DRAFT_323647 [Melanomma pulvis-pyrius CBS 109.77]|uniref:Uncharacterized protein n=1 Tax=Melanomma pulvis-pyrius CBS 109.77 TaxID=1314802 RepID=A0A6A6XHX0_9PLEO|nr:hypothetical protein K505DRAFT_323647 [Melanomma pulvis-pyrius CBS 109.77]
MALTFHALAIKPLVRGLKNLSAVLTKGEAHAVAASIDPQEYLDGRLAPDMYPLPQQIYRCTDAAKFLVSRITGLPALSLPDTEKTFPELQARVAKVIEYLEAVDEKAFEGLEDKEIVIHTGAPPGSDFKYESRFPAKDYVLYFGHPNFWFHVVTAYDILRHKGADVGKMDFLNGAGLVIPKAVPKE